MPVNYTYAGADGATIFAGGADDLGNLISSPSAPVLGTPQKICITNISDRVTGIVGGGSLLLKRLQEGTSDGIAYILTAQDPNGTVSCPWGAGVDGSGTPTGAPTAVVSAGSGTWSSTGAKGARITAVNGTGETIGSVEVSFTIVNTTDQVTLAWFQVPGATGYRVYVTDTPGTYTTPTLAATIGSGATVTATYSGAARSAGVPPAANTTGGAGPNYGSPPADLAFGTADITMFTGFAGMAVGQQFFFYFRSVLPAGATSLLNTRIMTIAPTEV